jgi:hypothetical protein
LEIEDVQTGEISHDYAEVLINATGWLKYNSTRMKLKLVHGSGLIFRVLKRSKGIYFTLLTGKRNILIQGNE